jgi:hypothetical protein
MGASNETPRMHNDEFDVEMTSSILNERKIGLKSANRKAIIYG